MDARAAAAIVIGNEVLSAKVADSNGPLLIRRLREQGVPLISLQTVPDEVDAIVEAVSLARRRARWLFTSGGIGPTHDDVTVRAVALALGRRVVELPQMAALIRRAFGDRKPPPEAMRLAEAPEGSSLLTGEPSKYPVLTCGDLFMLPGVPELFASQLELVLKTLPSARLVLRQLFVNAMEAEIAHLLDSVALEMPHVAIGSYPTFDASLGYRVKITIEHADEEPVRVVFERLQQNLPTGSIVRTG